MTGTGAAFAQETVSGAMARQGLPLGGERADAYRIAVREGEGLFGSVEQRGVDVVVVIRRPDGTVALEIDSPNGANGEEPILFIARTSGVHVLEVRAYDRAAPAGSYDLLLDAVRVPTGRDRDRVRALSEYLDGLRWRGEALTQLNQGRYAESAPLYEKAYRAAESALRARERAADANDQQVAMTHTLLGLIDDERGDYASGERHFSRALDILERRLGADHPGTITTRSDLAYLKLAAGRYREAAELFTAVIEQRERAFGADAVNDNLNALGEAWLELGDLERAEAAFTRRLALLEKTGASDHSTMSAWTALGTLRVAQGRLEDAEALCGRARAAAAARPQTSRPQLARLSTCFARWNLARGDAAAAVRDAREAVRLNESAYGPHGPPTAEALSLLGLALKASCDPGGAAESLRRALKIQREKLGPSHPATVRTSRALNDL
jgi:tetratricopeptide (TPR) repeat protein